MAQTWEALRKEARRLETEIDSKLVDYSKLLANANSPVHPRASSFDNLRVGDGTLTTPSTSMNGLRTRPSQLTTSESGPVAALQRRSGAHTRESALAATLAAADTGTAELDALLARLSSVIDALAADGSTAAASAGHRSHTVQRHSEILHDYHKEFRKTRKSVNALRDSADLFAGASASASRSSPPQAGANSGADALHAERIALAGASAAADSATGAGLSLKEDLERQRAMFASMVERMETMSEGIPAVNRLIGQIRRKKKRDVLILAMVVAMLLFFTFSWKLTH